MPLTGRTACGLSQINVDPAQTDTFVCSAIVQWASGTAREGDSDIIIDWLPDSDDDVDLPAVQTDDGLLLPAVRTGAWVADVTYERAASQPESANNIKQIVLAVHALDAGDCSVDICAQNSPPASPEPVTYTGGRFALEIDGHSSASPHQAPWLDELEWATDNNRADATPTYDDTSSCTSGKLSPLYALVESDFFLI